MNKKICFKCNKDKLLSEYYKHNKMADGHLNKCKECTKEDSTRHRWNNIEKVRLYDREKSKRKSSVTKRRRYFKYWSRKFKERRLAHGRLSQAIKSGTIIKGEKCGICKSTSKLEAHHDDYSKPLDVLWLCISCHRCLHRDLRKVLSLSSH